MWAAMGSLMRQMRSNAVTLSMRGSRNVRTMGEYEGTATISPSLLWNPRTSNESLTENTTCTGPAFSPTPPTTWMSIAQHSPNSSSPPIDPSNTKMDMAISRLRSAPGERRFTAPRQFLDPNVPEARALKKAAVLVPLFWSSDNQLAVLLTKRTSKMNLHRGEVCLPGGKHDKSDPDYAHTAMREAHEECGIPPDDVTVVTQFPPCATKSGVLVHPVVSVLSSGYRDARDFHANPHEVEEVFSMPLASFLSQEGHRWEPRATGLSSSLPLPLSSNRTNRRQRPVRRAIDVVIQRPRALLSFLARAGMGVLQEGTSEIHR
eukprot:CAMPEP_0114237458 /NCGR_PEP_ID=MMETSP0058-20121206/7401_1 /TAXON_ID=36894 /ORGANISM="Pyramimonas parkeae, CCMP726" /LENGTH=318 /DNA_ID=CAMNT_0001349501 /DNA_START=540 /DNA_END=1496 /DNA_ORIENTATION=+